jgi:hypothetical protein
MVVTALGAAVAVGDAGGCAGWLVQPVMRTARRRRPMQMMVKCFIVDEEFVQKNKPTDLTYKWRAGPVPEKGPAGSFFKCPFRMIALISLAG